MGLAGARQEHVLALGVSYTLAQRQTLVAGCLTFGGGAWHQAISGWLSHSHHAPPAPKVQPLHCLRTSMFSVNQASVLKLLGRFPLGDSSQCCGPQDSLRFLCLHCEHPRQFCCAVWESGLCTRDIGH